VYDIEAAGRQALSHRAYTYFSSASEDLSSLNNDADDWKQIRMRPRVLRNVAKIDMTRNILGYQSALPFFIAPTALVKLAHPQGELGLLRGAARRRIPYCVSTLASVTHEELTCVWQNELSHRTCLFFQLYVNKEKEKACEMIRLAKRLGYKALAVTVDTPVVGKREDDERDKLQVDYDAGILVEEESKDDDPTIEKAILRGVNSSTLNWEDLKWIKEEWGNQGPVVLKGIGSAEDVKMAQMLGIKAIWLSNHGGRQLASAPSAVSTLLEIRHFYPEVLRDVEVYLDGGVRRGSDIVKALCLGATGVAMGRPFLYGLGAFGVDGVVKVIQSKSPDVHSNARQLANRSVLVLSDEIETTMRLLGVNKLTDLRPEMVNASRLQAHIAPAMGDLQRRTSKL
jgi:L-lactate dehydrogenase (cytochrome)